MKILLFSVFCFISQVIYADGLDEVKIFKNGVLFEITNSVIDKQIAVNIGDTLRFEFWTDWGGTTAGELEILSLSDSSRVRLKRSDFNKYEVVFSIYLTENMLQKTFEFTYHYKDSLEEIQDIYRPWKFSVLLFN